MSAESIDVIVDVAGRPVHWLRHSWHRQSTYLACHRAKKTVDLTHGTQTVLRDEVVLLCGACQAEANSQAGRSRPSIDGQEERGLFD